MTESHHQKEQIVIANPDDPTSAVAHRLEDVHITVKHDATEEIKGESDESKGADNVHLRLDETNEAVAVTEKKDDVAHQAQGECALHAPLSLCSHGNGLFQRRLRN